MTIRFRVLFGAGLLGLMFLIIPAPQAIAHDDCVAQGEDVACVRYNHQRLDACDRELDGNRVYAVAINGRGDRWEVYDDNGSNSGCGHKWVSNPPITYFWVCEVVSSTNHVCSVHDDA